MLPCLTRSCLWIRTAISIQATRRKFPKRGAFGTLPDDQAYYSIKLSREALQFLCWKAKLVLYVLALVEIRLTSLLYHATCTCSLLKGSVHVVCWRLIANEASFSLQKKNMLSFYPQGTCTCSGRGRATWSMQPSKTPASFFSSANDEVSWAN